ncbi:MAG: hypothetical protein LBG89_00970 [Rickettsiales bacterium]|jgi:hypothetical protein|nr:hypothetical protein [Rickettsiales bacterium]
MNKKIFLAVGLTLASAAAFAAPLKFFKGLSWTKSAASPFVFAENTNPAARDQMVKFDKILSQCGVKLVYARANDGMKIELDGIGSFKYDDNFANGKVALVASARTPSLCPNGIGLAIGDEDANVRWTAQ